MFDPHSTESAQQREAELAEIFASSTDSIVRDPVSAESAPADPPLNTGAQPMADKPFDRTSIVLSMIGLAFSILVPLVTYVCSVIALVFAVRRRKVCNTNWALAMSVLSLVIAVLLHTLGIMMELEDEGLIAFAGHIFC